VLCTLVSVFNSDDVEGFVIGIPGLLGLLIGLGLSADSSYVWGGAIGGMLVGGLIGMLIFWLISNPIGQLLLLVFGTVGVFLKRNIATFQIPDNEYGGYINGKLYLSGNKLHYKTRSADWIFK